MVSATIKHLCLQETVCNLSVHHYLITLYCREVLQREVLEESVVSATIKHLCLQETVCNLSVHHYLITLYSREVLQREVLEESVVSATIKHLCLQETVCNLSALEENQSDDYWLLCSVISELFTRLDALIRQLQVGQLILKTMMP